MLKTKPMEFNTIKWNLQNKPLYLGLLSGVIISFVIWQLMGRMVLQGMFFPLLESTFVIMPLLGFLWPITLFLSGILMLFSSTRGFVSWWLKRALPLWFSLTIILFVLQIELLEVF